MIEIFTDLTDRAGRRQVQTHCDSSIMGCKGSGLKLNFQFAYSTLILCPWTDHRTSLGLIFKRRPLGPNRSHSI